MAGRILERGESKIGCFIALVVVLLAVIVLVKTVPVVVNVGEFQKEIETLAERASLPNFTDKKIEGRLQFKAQELHLPVSPDKIQIRRSREEITIHVEYDIRLDYPFYTYTWHKVHHVVRPLF